MFKKYIFRRKNIFSENTYLENRKETEKIVSQNLKVCHFYFFAPHSPFLSTSLVQTEKWMETETDIV